MKRQVAKINIYPIKSLDGYSPQTAKVLAEGFEYDRRWMLVDNNGVFLSQRTLPKMTLLAAEIIEDQWLNVFVKTNPSINIKILIDSDNATRQQVRVWDDVIDAIGVDKDADVFFSTYLGIDCHLVKYDPQVPRIVMHTATHSQHKVGFADALPYLLIGEASLQEIGLRLNNAHEDLYRRFRPNIVFTSSVPYEEDEWDKISIRNLDFKRIKKCSRCIMVNIHPDTAQVTKEVLNTLSICRKAGNKVNFGNYFSPVLDAHFTAKYIAIGDELLIY